MRLEAESRRLTGFSVLSRSYSIDTWVPWNRNCIKDVSCHPTFHHLCLPSQLPFRHSEDCWEEEESRNGEVREAVLSLGKVLRDKRARLPAFASFLAVSLTVSSTSPSLSLLLSAHIGWLQD